MATYCNDAANSLPICSLIAAFILALINMLDP
jgi:hypothetical protein